MRASGPGAASTTSPHSWYPTLHVLRGVAALAVVLLHGHLWRPNRIDAAWPGELWAFHFGYGGVYLFFVLSGFLMVQVSQQAHGPRPAARFLWARFARTVPIYWLLVLVSAALFVAWPAGAALHFGGGPTPDMTPEFLWANATTENVDLVPVAWTLYYEWWFYAAFAVTYVLVGRTAWIVAAIVWVGCIVYDGAANLASQHIAAGPWYASTNSLGLILGTVLGELVQTRAVHRSSLRAGLAAIVPVVGYTAFLVWSRGNDFLLEILWPLAWAPVVWTAVAWDRSHPDVRHHHAILAWPGTASYAIYLTHEGALWFGFTLVGYQTTAWAFVPVYGVVLAVAAAWYYGLERPLLRLLRRDAPAQRAGR